MMNSYTLIFLIPVFIFTSCQPIDEATPETLLVGNYSSKKGENLCILNDSTIVLSQKGIAIPLDTLTVRFDPPVFEDGVFKTSGSVVIISGLKENTELDAMLKIQNFGSSQLFYIKRMGNLMLLPNPETTLLSYVFQ